MPPTATAPRTIDLRTFEAASRLAAAFSAFDTLAAGGSFVLVAYEDPAPLLERLQRERPGRFEWSPLEEGPPLFRVEVARRRTDAGPRGVAEALGWDHDRLEDIERMAFEERGAGRLAEAAAVYGKFARGLRRHIGFEEGLLFRSSRGARGFPPKPAPPR